LSTRILTRRDVERLLPMSECVEVMTAALRHLATGDAVLPLRHMVWMPDRTGRLGLMPGYLGAPRSFGLKVVSLWPGNHGTDFDTHQGVVMLFGIENGEPLAILDASSITAIRTAAVSGVATRALAKADAGDLAILGSGVQAASHLAAMAAVRRLRRVRVWSRSRTHAESFASREGAKHGLSIATCATAREAVEGADLVCTTTAAQVPILEGAWLSPGAHINAVGACFAAARELDTEAVRRSRLYVDRRESVLAEAGDFLLARSEGAVQDDHIVAELGEVLSGRARGREDDSQVTLFESLGIAIEDLAAAHHVLAAAERTGSGIEIEFGGRHALA
jgi:ornithine cyclodeaminase/alanine dehydrogenase-like protein (mu-crystallin family)